MAAKKQPDQDLIGKYVQFTGYVDLTMDPLLEVGERLRIFGFYEPNDPSQPMGFKAHSDRFGPDEKGVIERISDPVFPKEFVLSSDQTPFASEEEFPIQIEGEDKVKKAAKPKAEKVKAATKPKAGKAKAAEPVVTPEPELALETPVAAPEPAVTVEPVAAEVPVAEPEAIPVQEISEEPTVDAEVETVNTPTNVIDNESERMTNGNSEPKSTWTLADVVLGEEADIPVEVPEPPDTTDAVKDEGGVYVQPIDAVRAALESGDMLNAAIKTHQDIELQFYTLGGILYEIERTGSYKEEDKYKGAEGFVKFCDEAVGCSYRRAMYLIKLYKRIQVLGLDYTKLAKVGWSKATKFLDLNDELLKLNYDELCEIGAQLSRPNLVVEIGRIKAGGVTEDEQVAKFKVAFTVTGDEAALFKGALETAAPKAGVDALVENFTREQIVMVFKYIVNDWASLANSGVVRPLADQIREIELIHDVRITAVPMSEVEDEDQETVNA